MGSGPIVDGEIVSRDWLIANRNVKFMASSDFQCVSHFNFSLSKIHPSTSDFSVAVIALIVYACHYIYEMGLSHL